MNVQTENNDGTEEENKCLVHLILQARYEEVAAFIKKEPESIYYSNHRSGRLALHEVCRQASLCSSLETPEDYSDSEDDDCGDEIGQVEESRKQAKLRDLAKLIIQTSATIEETSQTPQKLSLIGYRNQGQCLHFEMETQSILSLRDINGNTPLHILCANNSDPYMIHIILQAASSDLRDGPTPAALVKMKNDNGCTPLHFIAQGGCPFSAAKVIMKFCEGQHSSGEQHACSVQDEDGDTCLHWACSADISTRRLKLLIEEDPKSLMIIDHGGSFALDDYLADRYCNEAGEEEQMYCSEQLFRIDFILQAYYGIGSNTPWYPVHMVALTRFCKSYILKMILSAFRDHLGRRNERGMLPLHCAACCTPVQYQNETSKVTILLREYPRAALLPTNTGRFALHLALEHHQPVDIVKSLVFMAPETLTIPDPVTGLLPFMVAAVDDNSDDVNTVFELLLMNPELVRSAIEFQKWW